MELGQASEQALHFARREDERDSFSSQRRLRNLSAWADSWSSHCASSTTQSRLLFRGLRQQAKDCQSDQERIGGRSGRQPECD